MHWGQCINFVAKNGKESGEFRVFHGINNDPKLTLAATICSVYLADLASIRSTVPEWLSRSLESSKTWVSLLCVRIVPQQNFWLVWMRCASILMVIWWIESRALFTFMINVSYWGFTELMESWVLTSSAKLIVPNTVVINSGPSFIPKSLHFDRISWDRNPPGPLVRLLG